MTTVKTPRTTALNTTLRKATAVLSVIAAATVIPSQAALLASERAELVNLYNQTGGPSWTQNTGWTVGDPCSNNWYGISCNLEGTRVIRIALSNNQLAGQFPDLSAFNQLEVVYLGNNQLTGSVPSLNGLSGLITFEAYSNQLTGPIPSLSDLTNLAVLNIDSNQLSGELPSLSGLSKLTTVYASHNQLSGRIPPLTDLGELRVFHAANNQLSGELPTFAGSPHLSSFVVSNNQLTGPLPELSVAPGLWGFHADWNQLTGSIPSLAGLTELRGLHLNNNQLTGPLPSLAGLTKLENLSVSENRLTGAVPDSSGLPLAASGSRLCANYFTPASTPPSANDLRWNTATGATPWSTQCSTTPPEGRQMIEYRHRAFDYYFMTANPEHQTFLDGLAAWERTGDSFWTYTTTGSSLKPLKRYFFAEVALERQRGTHFFSLLESDTAILNALNPGNVAAPGLPFYEGNEAYAAQPTKSGLDGACAEDMVPVYRAFRGAARFPDNANHRFTTSLVRYNELVAAGWDAEGVNFCVPVR